MSYTHLRRADMGALLAFQALIEERSVSRAAARLCVTQPAVSRTLDRLQSLFDDELLVRAGSRYHPTPRALQAYAELCGLLPRLDAAIRGSAFEPSRSSDVHRMWAPEFASILFAPALTARLAAASPAASLSVRSDGDDGLALLQRGEVDHVLRVGHPGDGFRCVRLYEERLALLVSARLAAEAGLASTGTGQAATEADPPTIEPGRAPDNAGCAGDHWPGLWRNRTVAFCPQLGSDLPQRLHACGFGRLKALDLPGLLCAALAVERSDLALVAPQSLARQIASMTRTHPWPAPDGLAGVALMLAWLPRSDADPGHAWWRGQIEHCIGEASVESALPADEVGGA